MRIVLLGPPGAGKGSLASLTESQLGAPHISTGDIFRHEIARGSTLGKQVQRIVGSGKLVPDALVVRVMASRLTGRRLREGFVLDGFPRTRGQAEGLERVLAQRKAPLDGAVYITSPESTLIRRLSGRRVCSGCGAIYHLHTMRPKRPGRCDRCNERLSIRKDDHPVTVRRRLAVDRAEVAPLLRFYQQRKLLHYVNGAGRIERAFERLLRLYRRQGWAG